MATDGTSVYWTACGGGFSGVLRCPNSGCTATPEQLAGATTCPQGPIVVYGSDVVWLDNGAVKRCATGGCGGTATTVATAPALMGSTAAMELLAVAAHGVYWLSAGNLVGCSYPSCTGEPVTYATGVCPVVSDGVYRLQP
jgi:hypothetical protein